MKEKTDKLDFKKSKLSFYKRLLRHEKITIQREKIFAADTFDKRLVSELFKQLLKFRDNKTYVNSKINKIGGF